MEQLIGSEIEIIGPMQTEWTQSDRPVIFVDGGTRWRKDSAGFSVGDGDSGSGPIDLLLPQEKDVSDFGFVLRSLPDTVECIWLYGFNGGRFDHELANLGEISSFLEQRAKPCRAHIENRGLAFSAGTWTFEAQGLFSLFTLHTARVTLTGSCKYKLDLNQRLAPLSSHGLSNEGSGSVQVACDQPVFVFFPPT